MNDNKPEPQRFVPQKGGIGMSYALRGIKVFFSSTPNAIVHLVVFAVAIFFGVFFNITHFEWISLMLSGGFVVVAEAFNRAIEINVDLASPGFNALARDTKDVAAGAVLLSVITAVIVGIEVFWHYFAVMLS